MPEIDSTTVRSELSGADSERLFKIKLGLLHDAIFSSLVVLVPLEFFALLFLRHSPRVADQPTITVDQSAASRADGLRHALITAGCIDVATLVFLSSVASIERLHTTFWGLEDASKLNLFVWLMLLWLASLLTSFHAIYVTQYHEHGTVEVADGEPATG